MSTSLSKSLRLSSSFKMDEEGKVTDQKQGIVSILGSDVCERGKAASLRRTLSADMTSKKWLAQHGFSPMKKIASSEQFLVSIADSSSSSSEGEEDYEESKELEKPSGQFDIWSSIQSEEKKKNELENRGQFDIWSSILSQKADEDSSKSLPIQAPYIHPLVKRSASSLSEKSLEICTESLGSETGSEGFSSYPPSETGDIEEDKEEEEVEQEEQQEEEEEEEEKVSPHFDMEELRVVKYNCTYRKKSASKSFPPPLPSLSRHDGASLHMQSRRENGRLVLEAVSVPSQNCFRAQRQDGRLLLTFVNTPTSQEPNEGKMIEEEEDQEVRVFDEEIEKFEEEEEEEEEEEGQGEKYDDDDDDDDDEVEAEEEKVENVAKKMGIAIEQAPKLASEMMNVHHRPALMMNKLIRLANGNPTGPYQFNKVTKFEEEEEEEEPTPQPQSLPPRPPVGRLKSSPPTTAAASFNAYEYGWRSKPTAVAAILNQQHPPLKNNDNVFIVSKNPRAHDQPQQRLLLKGNKADYIVPMSRGCKEPRRSLLFWEPYCVATS